MTAQEYQISPELRRCCWYVIAGVAVLLPVVFWVGRFVQQRGATIDTVLGVVFVLIAAAMVLPLRWRLCLDQHGISRRLFFPWELWTWDDLASGRIHKLHPYTLHNATRTWGWRKMRLEYMSCGDIQEVFRVINTYYQLPPPPDVPDTLTIKYGFRRSATLGDKGICLLIGNTSREYQWRDLRQVHFTRMDPVRRDFKSLVIALPDREIELKLVTHQGGTSPTWRGATAEVISEFLLREISPDKIDTTTVGESLEKREHVERELQTAEKGRREFTIMLGIFLPLLAAVFVWMAIADGVAKAVFAAGPVDVFLVFLFVYRIRSQRTEIDRLKNLLNSVVEKEGQPDDNLAT